ncbi:MAG: ABC transporter permease [Bacteroidales bacterium]|jgi:ABC-2 type transport system permease protein|nr:ABC transporter permease [Bacteroidales bacterium]
MKRAIFDLFLVYRDELRHIFSDATVIVLFFAGTLIYPLIYSWIYNNENIHDMPVAVVDMDHSAQSREFIRMLDATQETAVTHRCASMTEAKHLLEDKKIHGVVLVPSKFGDDIMRQQQTTVSVYADMSSFLYYKALLAANNYVSQTMGGGIQAKRLMAAGATETEAMATVTPISSYFIPLYNIGGGYAGFLIPAVLLLVIHQTLLLGICILAGINREKNGFRLLIPMSERYHGTLRIVGGKALAYFSIYIVLVFYVLMIVPRWFGLPHIGRPLDLYLFFLPFLLATIFFAMTISVFFRDRETPILILLFLSVPLLFLSGVAWPIDQMPFFWRLLSFIFPSTHGVQGFVKINSMGADLSQVRMEYLILSIQAVVYFITAFLLYRKQIIRTEKFKVAHNIAD